MAVYLVAYDLVKESSIDDYTPLWNELDRIGGHRTQLSLWLINVSNTPKEIVDHLKQFVDDNDRIWITELRANGYTFVNAIAGTKDWLKANPPRV